MPLSRSPSVPERVAEVVLRHRPLQRHALAGVFLQRGAEGGDGFEQAGGAAFALAERPERGAEVVLRHGPVERSFRAGRQEQGRSIDRDRVSQRLIVAELVSMVVEGGGFAKPVGPCRRGVSRNDFSRGAVMGGFGTVVETQARRGGAFGTGGCRTLAPVLGERFQFFHSREIEPLGFRQARVGGVEVSRAYLLAGLLPQRLDARIVVGEAAEAFAQFAIFFGLRAQFLLKLRGVHFSRQLAEAFQNASQDRAGRACLGLDRGQQARFHCRLAGGGRFLPTFQSVQVGQDGHSERNFRGVAEGLVALQGRVGVFDQTAQEARADRVRTEQLVPRGRGAAHNQGGDCVRIVFRRDDVGRARQAARQNVVERGNRRIGVGTAGGIAGKLVFQPFAGVAFDLTAELPDRLLCSVAGRAFAEGEGRVSDVAACVKQAGGRFEIKSLRSRREERTGQRGQLDDAGGFKHRRKV